MMRATLICTLIAVLSPIYIGSARAQDNTPESKDSSVESYKIESEVDHKKVVTWIHIFPKPPIAQEVVPQIKEINPDHVAIVGEEPSAQLQEIGEKIKNETDVPVVEVRPKKGFFARLKEVWKLSFNNKELKPGKADYRYGLISTTAETASIAAVVFSEPNTSIYLASALVAANTLFSYVNNVHNNAVNHFLSSSIKRVGEKVSNKLYFAKSITYDFITSQLIKFMQSPAAFLSAEAQSTVFLYTLFSATGEILISNANYLSYKNDPVKLAKMNFYTFALSNILGGIELLRPDWMPVITNIGAYELAVSTVGLIVYYGGMTALIKTAPEKVFAFFEGLDRGAKKIGNWVSARVTDCKRLLRGRNSNDETAQLESVSKAVVSFATTQLRSSEHEGEAA